MSKRIKYTNEPLELERVKDFLPPPEELALKEETVKVTMTLSKRTVDFFKTRARQRGARYQRMIRRLLDVYVSRHD
jgi:predicted DNA binding CopG/RHH family protein